MNDDQPKNPMSSAKPRFLMKGSPLTAGGKARLMSARKVDPKPARPREVSKVEAQGYTEQPHKALKGEPECVGPAIVDGYAESARFYESLRHLAEIEAAQQARKLLTAEQRLIDVERRRKQNHVTAMSREFHTARQMLGRARNGGRKDPPAAVRIIERLEGELDGLSRAA